MEIAKVSSIGKAGMVAGGVKDKSAETQHNEHGISLMSQKIISF